MPRVALAIFVVALWVYGIIDCARTPRSSMPGRLPKWVWMMVVVVPILGTILWLVLAWPIKHPDGFGTLSLGPRSAPQPSPGPVAPDDDPEFLAKLEARNRFAEWERQQALKDSDESQSDNLDDELQALLAAEDSAGQSGKGAGPSGKRAGQSGKGKNGGSSKAADAGSAEGSRAESSRTADGAEGSGKGTNRGRAKTDKGEVASDEDTEEAPGDDAPAPAAG